ncbi:hypothetical protein DUNSADRAFT_5717 [Dunaliella salina]|uniref:Encoded protein n=1 Tax=Dunaliella salina TaxID=3046 RepID=A0ABQ7GPS0_DUNSA|nr:hypothetical protein DUNSADRAFT_5717 [Dunaliella salina]|eukprot:KAF5836600.1 hypothetical protein DUNSADRAFT_5717 [Dunaliella salina]
MLLAKAILGRAKSPSILASALPGNLSRISNFSTTQEAQKAKAEKEAKDNEEMKQAQGEGPKPTYTYASPGSSLKEAGYGISFSDPVYVVDPAPKPKGKNSDNGVVAIKPEEVGEDFQQPGSDGVPPHPVSSK